jgi:hypothetical protein
MTVSYSSLMERERESLGVLCCVINEHTRHAREESIVEEKCTPHLKSIKTKLARFARRNPYGLIRRGW